MPRRPQRKAYRERVTIEAPATQPDEYGHDKIIGYNPVLSHIPASFEYIRGFETFRGRQVAAEVDAVFEMRVPEQYITPKMVVVHLTDANRKYEIYSVKPVSDELGAYGAFMVFVKAVNDDAGYGRKATVDL